MQKIDVEKLINEVEKRPALWDMRTSQYSDREMRRQCWGEICDLFANDDMSTTERNELTNVLHKKWKNIRDNFSRDIQGRKRRSGSEGGTVKSPYMYSQQLQFLRDTIEPKETSNSLQGSLQQELNMVENGASSSAATPPQTNIGSPRIGKKKKKVHSVEERIILSLERLDKNQQESREDDDNRHFLLSLLPIMTSLPRRLNSRCRLELMQIINKYEEQAFIQRNQEPSTSSAPVYHNLERHHLDMLQPTQYQPPRKQQQLLQHVNFSNNNYFQPERLGVTSPVDSLASYVSNFSEDSTF